jgi:hypothetical protein
LSSSSDANGAEDSSPGNRDCPSACEPSDSSGPKGLDNNGLAGLELDEVDISEEVNDSNSPEPKGLEENGNAGLVLDEADISEENENDSNSREPNGLDENGRVESDLDEVDVSEEDDEANSDELTELDKNDVADSDPDDGDIKEKIVRSSTAPVNAGIEVDESPNDISRFEGKSAASTTSDSDSSEDLGDFSSGASTSGEDSVLVAGIERSSRIGSEIFFFLEQQSLRVAQCSFLLFQQSWIVFPIAMRLSPVATE